MSMFKKMLASVGIGAAQVDLMLHESHVRPGDTLTGVVRIQGGRVEQQVDAIYAFVKTNYIKEQDDKKYNVEATVSKHQLTGPMLVEPERTYEFPVSFELPANTPATLGRTPVWIQTGMDIKDAVDPKDRDILHVSPHPYAAAVLAAVVDHLGFRLREVTCEYAPKYSSSGQPFVQEFEFVPASQFRSELDELEIFFTPYEQGIELLLQIDRKARGLSGWLAEAMDADEHFVKVNFSSRDIEQGPQFIASELQRLIRSYV